MDKEEFKAAIIANSWAERNSVMDLDEEIIRLDSIMERSCDAVMRRVSSLPARRKMYWWSEEFAQLRRGGLLADARRKGGGQQRR